MSAKAKKILIDWANNEKNWIRSIVKEVVETHTILSELSLDSTFQTFLSDSDLNDVPVKEIPKLIIESTDSDKIDQLLINKIEKIENVNKLLAEQSIEFNKNLTVLFGENATGKSGYVRVLKRLAAVRSQEEILPNIHDSDGQNKPRAEIHYSLGESNYTLDWNGSAGVNPFTRMCIFDNRALSFHVDDDLTYYYIPKDISLFKFTHETIQQIKEMLDNKIKEDRPAGNPFLSNFNKESKIYTKVETLGPSTDLKELEALADLKDQEKEYIVSLQEQVEALKPKIIDSRLELTKSNKALFERVLFFATTIQKFDWDTYNDHINNLNILKKKHKEITEDNFKEVKIDGIFGDTWQSFIEAGEAHLREINQHDYPDSNDICIYCHQDLNDSAINLIKKYREYCNNQVKTEIDKLYNDINDVLKPIFNLNISNIKETLEQQEGSALNSGEMKVVKNTLELVYELDRVLEKLNNQENVIVEKCKKLSFEICSKCTDILANIEELLTALNKQGQEREKEFIKKRKELYDIQDRVTLSEKLSQIKSYVNSMKWVNKASIISTSIPSILRSLTIQTKLASDDLLNRDFEHYFESECKQLNAPNVKIEFPGREGQAARRKSLHDSYRLSDILSEGEQKVIALADFLAESFIRTSSGPIIFDDPVTSLDYKRLDYIVKRILELCRENQVIVFTHSIWFAVSLLEYFSEKSERRDQCAYYEVSKDGELVGKINRGSHPRWDTPKIMKRKINKLIQDAESIDGEAQIALIERIYDHIRSWCEVVMEQEILQHIVQRYSPHVALTMIPQINFEKLEETSNSILELYSKACRVMEGHSQPLETLHTNISIDELKGDWNSALDALSAYHNK